MALIECEDCNGKVSTKAASCPHCGAPVEPNQQESQPVPIVTAPPLVGSEQQSRPRVSRAAPAPQGARPKTETRPRSDTIQNSSKQTIPPHICAKVAEQLSKGASIETTIRQLVAVGYEKDAVELVVGQCIQTKHRGHVGNPSTAASKALRVTAIILSVLWMGLGLIATLQAVGLPVGFTILTGAIIVFSALTGLFLILGKDNWTLPCVLGAGLLTFPLGLVFIFSVLAAIKNRNVTDPAVR